MRRRYGVTVLCLCLIAGLAAAAESRRSLSERIRVTQVEIPVQVLRKGEPVRGLTADDFEVLDRGVPQEIVSFEVLDLSDEATIPSAEPGGVETQTHPGRRRHMLLLVDLDFTAWRYLPRALDGAREMLEGQLHPSDRVAVGFYSSFFGPQLLHGFIDEREPSLVALDAIRAVVERQPQRVAEHLSELSRIADLRFEGEEADLETWRRVAGQWAKAILRPVGDPAVSAPSVGGRSRDVVSLDPVRRGVAYEPGLADEPIVRRVRELGRQLRGLARDLATVPEPKQILFLSEGFPSRFLEDRNHSTRTIFRLDTALKAFLETGWILQAVDVRGIPSAGERAFDGNALFHLAHHSGGRLYENFNRIERATEKIIDRSSVTYVLVIQPDVEADGRFHELEVRLPGVRRADLHYRPGYRAPTRADRPRDLDDRRDIAELVLAEREFRDFEVDLLAVPVPATEGRTRMPVLVEIPGEALVERGFGGVASLEVHAYALDDFGSIQDLFIRRVDIDLARDGRRLERGGLRLSGALELGSGRGEIRVLVRSLADDALSLVRMPIEVAELDSASLVALPPLFLDRSRDWLSLSLGGEDDRSERIETLAGLGSDFFPQVTPVFRGDREQRLVFNLFYSTAETPLVQLRLLTARGEEMAAPELRFHQRYVGEAGATGLVATWKPKELPPGGYTLEIALVDPATGRRVTGTTQFKIVEPS